MALTDVETPKPERPHAQGPSSGLERWKLRFESAYALLASIAILVAGGWALYTYVIQREGVWNIDMSLSTETVAYGPAQSLLVLKVNLENRGKRKVTPADHGLRLSISKVPKDAVPWTLVWRDGRRLENGETVINSYDMLGHYDGDYDVEPGAVYQETEALVVDSDAVLLITLQFFGPDKDFITQYYYVKATPGAPSPVKVESHPARRNTHHSGG